MPPLLFHRDLAAHVLASDAMRGNSAAMPLTGNLASGIVAVSPPPNAADAFSAGTELPLDGEKIRTRVVKANRFCLSVDEILKVKTDARTAKLRELEAREDLARLSTEETAMLFNAYKYLGDDANMVRVYETTPNSEFLASDLMQAAYVAGLQRLGRFDDGIAVCEALLKSNPSHFEIWASLGSLYFGLYKRDAATDGAAASVWLERATKAYEAAFLGNSTPYPGLKLLYCFFAAGRDEEARLLAPLVRHNLILAGGARATNFWTLSWYLEYSCLVGDYATANFLLPRALRFAEKSSVLDSAASNLSRLLAKRADSKRDADALQSILDKFALRRDALQNHAAYEPPPAPIEFPDENQTTRAILDRAFSYQGLRTHLVEGNLKSGGQVHSQIINVRDLEDARDILAVLGLANEADFEIWDKTVNRALEILFRLKDPVSGARWMENIADPRHAHFDAVTMGLIQFFGAHITQDGRTNVILEALLGYGDCRSVAYAKQLLFDVWKKGHVTDLLNQAYRTAARQGDSPAYRELLARMNSWQKKQLYVFEVALMGEVAVKKKYEYLRDPRGRLLKGAEITALENHTFNALVEFDDDGQVAHLETRDAFYNQVFALEKVPLALAEIHDTNGFRVTTWQVYDPAQERFVAVPIYAKPARYSRKRDIRALDDHGQRRLRGYPVFWGQTLTFYISHLLGSLM